MGIKNIGEVIHILRKAKGITQEELANNVGVSTQAVSKWECGGVPDTELLPVIADYFEVSIDTLFGRDISDYTDAYTAAAKKLAAVEPENRMTELFELIWILQNATFGRTDPDDIMDLSKIRKDDKYTSYSRIIWDSGISMFNLSINAPYVFIIPESDERSGKLLDGIDYIPLFKMLSERDAFDALILLHKKDHKAFTPKLIEKSLNITFERAQEIINLFKNYNFITTTEIELDNELQYVYTFRYSPSFIAFLTFAHEIITPPNNFYIFHGGRNKTYL